MGGIVRVHAPEAVRPVVLVLGAGAGGRLAIGPGLDVAAHGEDQALGGRSDLGNGRVERGDVAGGWHAESTDLAHVLAGGRLDLARGRGVVLMAEGSDASTHAGSVPQAPRFAPRHSATRAPVRAGITSWMAEEL